MPFSQGLSKNARRRRLGARLRPTLGLGLVLLLLAACGEEPGPQPGTAGPDDAVLKARVRAAAHFAREEYADAAKEVAWLLAQPNSAAEDHVRAAIVADWLGKPGAMERARKHFQQAIALDPASASAHYGLGVLMQRQDERLALRHLQRAHELAPEDYPTQLHLAMLHANLEAPEKAAEILERLERVGVDRAGSWHVVTLYNLGQLRMRQDRREEALALLEQYKQLQARGIKAPSADEVRRGNLGRLHVPDPDGHTRPAPRVPAWRAADTLRAAGNGQHVRAVTLRDDWRHVEDTCFVAPPDLLVWGSDGLSALHHDGKGFGAAQKIHDSAVDLVATADLDQNGTLDVVFVSAGAMRLRMGSDDGWQAPGFELPTLPAPARDMVPVDYDHDGDLDLLLVGSFGARLWRNDGISEGGSFTEVGADAGLPTKEALAWCLIEDFDTDQDIDLLVGGETSAPRLLDNRRGGRFRTVVLDMPAQPTRPLALDTDADGRPDLVLNAPKPALRRGLALAGFGTPSDLTPTEPPRLAADLDLDGVPDLVGLDTAGRPRGILAPAADGGTAFGDPTNSTTHTIASCCDLDGDRLADLVVTGPDGVQLLHGTEGGGAFLLALRGTKDNRRGVGAIVEVRAGGRYQRILWTGEPRLIGLDGEAGADVLRVTWPNGIIQYDMDLEAGCARLLEQSEGLVGSCPFLYTWNGSTYEFITDVLGITPLGLPMAPGMLVPPDHDEYVLVRGEQMKPRRLPSGETVYEMQFTEELREVTYLDRAKLLVVDHPADTEIQPNERFSFPPMPKPHTHVVRPFAPRRATGSDGKDLTAALATSDGDYAAPFEPHRGQFLGLAPRHWVEVEFEPARIPDAGQLRLLLTGWFYWTDASVNMAVARTPGVAFEPPVLLVPDEAHPDGWRPTGPPVGFPAGKRKTMVLDVTKLLNRKDPRLRIATTLRLYWDAIRLAAGPDAEARTQVVEPSSAHLWERGFSRPIPTFGEHALDWFDWSQLDQPRWDPHPGMYTRLGEVRPLLESIDDCYVIMASGDALRVRFPTDGLKPVPEGWRRDFLVFLDGWAKDRDPNTHEAEFVEPLPFHGMSGYPYKADEAYPTTEKHETYRATWNTRPARHRVAPVRPTRPAPRVR